MKRQTRSNSVPQLFLKNEKKTPSPTGCLQLMLLAVTWFSEVYVTKASASLFERTVQWTKSKSIRSRHAKPSNGLAYIHKLHLWLSTWWLLRIHLAGKLANMSYFWFQNTLSSFFTSQKKITTQILNGLFVHSIQL